MTEQERRDELADEIENDDRWAMREDGRAEIVQPGPRAEAMQDVIVSIEPRDHPVLPFWVRAGPMEIGSISAAKAKQYAEKMEAELASPGWDEDVAQRR